MLMRSWRFMKASWALDALSMILITLLVENLGNRILKLWRGKKCIKWYISIKSGLFVVLRASTICLYFTEFAWPAGVYRYVETVTHFCAKSRGKYSLPYQGVLLVLLRSWRSTTLALFTHVAFVSRALVVQTRTGSWHRAFCQWCQKLSSS